MFESFVKLFVEGAHYVNMSEAGWSSSSSQGSNWARSRVIVNGTPVKFGETSLTVRGGNTEPSFLI